MNDTSKGTTVKDTPLDRLRHVYSGRSQDDLKAAQADYIERYRAARNRGDDNRAETLLATINDFSTLLQEKEAK